MAGISIVILALTFVMGGFIAYYNNSWWTFFGATLGLVSYWFYEGLALWMLQFLESRRSLKSPNIKRRAGLKIKLYKIVKKLFYLFGNLFVFQEENKLNAYLTQLRIIELARYCWKIISVEYRDVKRTLLTSGFANAPIFYIRWFVIGLVVVEISTSIREQSITLKLDIYLGILIALTFFKESVSENEREALTEVQTMLPLIVSDKVYQLQLSDQNNSPTSISKLFSLRNALRKKEYALGQFASNAWQVLVSAYGLLIVILVLFAISIPGSLLALVSVIVVLPAMIFGSFSADMQGRMIGLIKYKRGILAELLEDERFSISLQRVAPRGAVVDQVSALGVEQVKLVRTNRYHHRLMKLISRLVFFTLFSLSILFPVIGIQSGGMSTRVVILYAFSMMSLWYAIGNIAYRSGKLIKGIFELEEVEESILLIKINNITNHRKHNHSHGSTKLNMSNELCVSEFNFGFPWRELVLKNPKKIIIPPTISTSNVVRVLGEEKSILIKLLAGNLKPTFGSIYFTDGLDMVSDLTDRIILLPDIIPNFNKGRIIEIFHAFTGGRLKELCLDNAAMTEANCEVKVVEEILSKFGLLKKIKFKGQEEYTGANLTLGKFGNFLDEDQNRLLFLALNYAALKIRLKTPSFKPLLIIVDGSYRLSSFEDRKNVASLFKEISDECSATLVLAAKDGREIGLLNGNKEYVFRCVAPKDLPKELTIEGEEVTLVTFGKHGDLFEHTDPIQQSRYRSYLNVLQDRI